MAAYTGGIGDETPSLGNGEAYDRGYSLTTAALMIVVDPYLHRMGDTLGCEEAGSRLPCRSRKARHPTEQVNCQNLQLSAAAGD
jgi:hypothetical protein